MKEKIGEKHNGIGPGETPTSKRLGHIRHPGRRRRNSRGEIITKTTPGMGRTRKRPPRRLSRTCHRNSRHKKMGRGSRADGNSVGRCEKDKYYRGKLPDAEKERLGEVKRHQARREKERQKREAVKYERPYRDIRDNGRNHGRRAGRR